MSPKEGYADPMEKAPVSVIVPVKNEEANLRRSLPALPWADEIFVVDSQSTDGTVKLAQSLGANVVQFYFNGTYPKKKNWALESLPLRNEWVLIVDADEVLTPELAAEIRDAVKRDGVDEYYINRRFMFMGRWIKHCGYYPSWNLRLFKHRLGRYERLGDHADTGSGDNEVHEHIVVNGKAATLKNAMLHFAYPDIATWIEKHNRYSSWEAHMSVTSHDGHTVRLVQAPLGLRMKRTLRSASRALPWRPTFRFAYHYILRGGFLDGREGLILCRLMGWYEYISMVKETELRRKLV